MDPITIKGIRIQSLSLDLTKEELEVSATYVLISSLDRVLAKQGLGGYNDTKLTMSAGTQQALVTFLRAYKNDVNNLLGLPTE